MTHTRVVALAATCYFITTSPVALAVTAELDSLPSLLLPEVAPLLAPAAAKPAMFHDPYRLDARDRFVLASPRHWAARIAPPLTGPPLPALTRRNLNTRIRQVLPDYDQMFRRVGNDYRLPPSLLAAQAYLESKWRPHARSRHAAGMMMLTARTARVVKVSNRLSARQSVRGAARYLDRLRALLPASVPYPDRNLLAQAAYNMGLAHLQDARALAERLGKNPNLWSTLREVLPLMAERRYSSTLANGYVRGAHVVRYVDQIKRYQAIIAPHIGG